MRILVIEDNQDVARQIRETLEEDLFVVDVAHDGVLVRQEHIEFADAPRKMWGWNGGTF